MRSEHVNYTINPILPTVAFNICCPRDCVSRHNGGTVGAPLNPLRVDSALRALSTLRGLRGFLFFFHVKNNKKKISYIFFEIYMRFRKFEAFFYGVIRKYKI